MSNYHDGKVKIEVKVIGGRVDYIYRTHMCILGENNDLYYIFFDKQREFKKNSYHEGQLLWVYYKDSKDRSVVSLISKKECPDKAYMPEPLPILEAVG